MARIEFQRYKSTVILTGAGISAPSGLSTYRGPGGVWNDPDTRKFSNGEGFVANPDGCWKFWSELKQKAVDAQPNAAHNALAQWEKALQSGQRFTLITQNVDGLHQRAGSVNVVEIHGTLFKTRCSNDACKLAPYQDERVYLESAPMCSLCNQPLRPNITLFDEALPPEAEHAAKRSMRDCDLFVAIGTSGSVNPAAQFVNWAKYAGAHTVCINLEPMNPRNSAFDVELIGPAEKVLSSALPASVLNQ